MYLFPRDDNLSVLGTLADTILLKTRYAIFFNHPTLTT